ncbi:ceramide synthase [Chloropicon primus]|uniref:Ceramide synthase n=1 Tax=Chloropicon primus TaxID=1764295 RepID=A0A5B8MNI2_9CHLO|nr:ceramide synthase [Chloropicon primus]UPR01292.1 ceramide synthase [Chloropicon primus]|eukprot:QDZ22073.1 ceramide synthase [Chloropicon primus]
MALFHAARFWTLKHSAWIALVFIAARAAMNAATRRGLEAYGRRKGVKVEVDKLQEEIWLVVCGTVLSAFSGCLLARGPSFEGCNVFDTSRCYADFSVEEIPREIMAYYLIEVGWYVSLILKSVVGVGRFDSLVMEFHHVATLALVIWSYVTGFTKIGVVTFFVFNQSNPLLHLSKFLNYVDPGGKTNFYAFVLFTIVFVLSRIVLLLGVVIRSTFFELPHSVTWTDWRTTVVYTWYTSNTLLVALWLLQIYWLRPILRIAGVAAKGKKVKDDVITADDDVSPANNKEE